MTPATAIEVLLVEDNPGDVRLVEILLSEVDAPSFNITHVERLDEAVEHLSEAEFDVNLLDLSLPDSSGLETVNRMRAAAPEIPMVVLSGWDDEETALRALQSGAEDYLVKGRGDGELMARAIRYSIERKNAQKTLRRSEELYRTVVEQAAENIFLVDAKTKRILEANPALCTSLDYTPEELREMTLYDIVAHDRKSVDRNTELIMKEGYCSVGDRRYRRKDGSLADVEVNARAISYVGGDAMCIVAHDVTERKRIEEELRHSLGVLLALHEAGQILVSSLDLEGIGPRLLEIMRRVADLTAAVIILQDEHGELRTRHAVGSAKAWSAAHKTLKAREARLTATDTGQPRSFRLDPTGSSALPPVGLCLPLRVRGHPIGVIEVYGQKHLAERANIEILTSLAGQAGSALENARLHGQLAERERRLEELVGRLIKAQEEERRRVAYDVHDGLAQVAAAAHQRLQAFAGRHAPASEEGREDLERVLRLVRRTVGEARKVISDLRPTVLDDFGLAAAIRQEVAELRDGGWRVEYEEALGEERLPVAVETALFRVVQEALTNARKHALTDRVRLELRHQGETITLKVEDRGRGFDPAAADGDGGPGERVGLSGMRERVGMVGGELVVRSRPGAGTSITVRIPLSEQTGARDPAPGNDAR